MKREGFFINGYSLSNLILHIAIALERCLNGFPACGQRVSGGRAQTSSEVDRVTEDILGGIEEKYLVSFSAADRRSLKLILSTCLVDVDSLEDARPQNSQVARLLDHIRARVSSEYAVDLSDGEFGVRFSLHLENLLARGESDVVLRNPQFDLIKNAYPYVYEIAVFIAEIIQSDTGLMVSEDEIAFIALHVGCFIEEQGSRGNKLRALVVTPALQRAERLARRAPERLLRAGPLHRRGGGGARRDPLRRARSDIIISTQELREDGSRRPWSRSRRFWARWTGRSSARASTRSARRRAAARWSATSTRSFRSDLFFIGTPFQGRAGRDRGDGRRASWSASSRSPTSRSASTRARRSARACTATSPCRTPSTWMGSRRRWRSRCTPSRSSWMGSPVHAVFMLCVTREDRSFFREVFEFVAHVLNEPTSVQTVSRARTFEEFVETLLRYY